MNNQFDSKILEDNVQIISIGRSLDDSNAHILLEQLERAIDGNFSHIYLDLKNCELLSSSGVGAIISNVEAARAAGGEVTLLQPSEAVMTILHALGLLSVLKIQETPISGLKGVVPK